MKLFLIRHAQSIDDEAKLSQRDESGLSAQGIRQAKKRQELIKDVAVTAVYASPYARTQETASLIFPFLPVNTLDFIYEIKRPQHLDGGLHENAVHFWEVEHKVDKYRPDWTFDGSESFNDVLNRAVKLFDLLYDSHTENETIAIVSHGGFMRHVIGYAGMKNAYTPEVFFDLFFLMQIKNADMLEIDLSDKKLLKWTIRPLI
jgi:probable phosphoglycerate mutase